MGVLYTTLVQCCCACDCEQFGGILISVSVEIDVSYLAEEGGVSHWECAFSADHDVAITYDAEAEPTCGQLIHDPEDAPETCNYALGDTTCYLAEAVPFTYPDPDIPYDLDEDSTDKTVNLDLVIDGITVSVDCEGNGTLSISFHLDGDSGEIAEVLAEQAAGVFNPLLESPTQIDITLVNWAGVLVESVPYVIDPEVGFGFYGEGQLAATAEFSLLPPP